MNEEINFPHTPQLLFNPVMIHPMSAFAQRSSNKAAFSSKTKNPRIIVQTSQNNRLPCRVRHDSLPKTNKQSEFEGLLRQKSVKQKTHSAEKYHDTTQQAASYQLQKLQRMQRKLQTNGDEFDDNVHNKLSIQESKKLIQSFRAKPQDIDKTKVILQNILTGMQHKLDDFTTEKHMKIFGMQIKGFPKEKKEALKEAHKESIREPSKSFVDEAEFKRKRESQQQQKRKPSPQIETRKTPSSQILKQTNFKFSLADYSQLSREQMFQLKLTNYHHFLFVISLQSNFYTIPTNQITEYKFKVGRGNNSLLIKEAFKNRWWWNLYTLSDTEFIMQFMWTQIKVPSFMNQQNLSRPVVMKSCSTSYTSLEQLTKKSQTASKDKSRKQQQPAKTESIQDRFGKYQDPLQKLLTDNQMIQIKSVDKQIPEYIKFAEKLNLKFVTYPNIDYLKIHNHIERNYHLGNKKALFHNLKKYYELTGQDLFSIVPITYHIQKGTKDKAYQQFQEDFKGEKSKIWIVKPGEFTNRGTGIHVCSNLQEIHRLVAKKQTHPNGKQFTHLIQKYLDRPLLYNKRKFDIRCYFLITQLNGIIRAYWYEEGYIRTASEEFNLKDCSNQYVHLTNDAIQKYSDDYGKFESGNKLSFVEFQRYLDMWHSSDRFDFFRDLYPEMKRITTNSIKSVYYKLEKFKKDHNFEIFGLDFMIDADFKPWLIEINTNPCLELSCPLLGRIIPAMVENALRLSIDTIVPPPDASIWPPCKKHLIFYDNVLENNRFQLIFDEREDGPELKQLYLNVSPDGIVYFNLQRLLMRWTKMKKNTDPMMTDFIQLQKKIGQMLKKQKSEQIDIIFEAGEDLLNQQKQQVIMLKNNSIRLPITRPRTFLSYSFEFCGITGLNYKLLRFQSLGRDIRPETNIMTACLVKVIHTSEFAQMLQNPLKTSMQQLFLSGAFSDVIIKLNDEITLPLHKSILSCRSPKFNGLFSSNLMEMEAQTVKVECKKPELFKLMLQWIYSGYWKEFPDDIDDTCDLLLLADEYMIVDMKQKCEEDIISKLNVNNILNILLFVAKQSDMIQPMLVDKAHTLFIEDFDRIHKIHPNLEQEITKVPGLVTKLFQNVHSKKLKKPRKVHFVVDEYESQQQESDSDNNSQDYIRNYTQHFYS